MIDGLKREKERLRTNEARDCWPWLNALSADVDVCIPRQNKSVNCIKIQQAVKVVPSHFIFSALFTHKV